MVSGPLRRLLLFNFYPPESRENSHYRDSQGVKVPAVEHCVWHGDQRPAIVRPPR